MKKMGSHAVVILVVDTRIETHVGAKARSETLFHSRKIERLNDVCFTTGRHDKNETLDWTLLYNESRLQPTS